MKLLLASCALGLAACGSTPNRTVPAQAAPAGGRPAVDREAGDRGVETSPTDPPREAAGAGPAAPVESFEAEPRPTVVAPPAASAGPTDLVARVAGQPIFAADLLDAWLHRASSEVRATLEELILSRLVLLEASRLEIELEAATLERARREVLGRLEEQVRRAGGGLATEEFIRRRLGLDPATYFDRLARETTIDLLAERVVRAWVLASERAEVRVIVLDERAAVEKVEERLADGVAFAEVAEEFSIEESGKDGGRIPTVVRGESALARLAFATPVGEIGGPVFEENRWLFLRVEERPRPRAGTWSEVGADVEASLARAGIEDPEYWQWKADVLRRFEVDTTPLLELVGQPTGAQ